MCDVVNLQTGCWSVEVLLIGNDCRWKSVLNFIRIIFKVLTYSNYDLISLVVKF